MFFLLARRSILLKTLPKVLKTESRVFPNTPQPGLANNFFFPYGIALMNVTFMLNFN